MRQDTIDVMQISFKKIVTDTLPRETSVVGILSSMSIDSSHVIKK